MGKNENSLDDRRRVKRYRVRIPVGVYNRDKPQNVIDGEMRDISEMGAFIHCSGPVEVGDKILVELRLGDPRFFPGVVVEREQKAQPNLPPGIPASAVIRWADTTNGFGVEFVDLDPDKRRFLTMLIQSLAKQPDEK